MGRLSSNDTYPWQQESGRTCGCDPKAAHVCVEHKARVDETESEVCSADEFNGGERQRIGLVVTGPDRDGEFGLLASDVVYMNRFEAEALAREILRRVELKGAA